jgi:hypothetical protein
MEPPPRLVGKVSKPNGIFEIPRSMPLEWAEQ